MAVPNTNVKLKAEIADECKVVQTTDISISAMATSDVTVGGITTLGGSACLSNA